METQPDEENGLMGGPTGMPPRQASIIKDYKACKTLDAYDSLMQDEPMTCTWTNLNVSVGPERESVIREGLGFDYSSRKLGRRPQIFEAQISKQILYNVTGIAKPHELVAIMGVSGAGKTTLLNALTFRHPRNMEVSGDRCVNGQQMNADIVKAISGYVTQDEIYIPSLTVREHLIFNARLRMHSAIPYKDRLRRVDEVIDELGLRGCANTRIGQTGKKKAISGGEARRLSFATEVLTDPPILFCDEPTSGLDSFMAQNVVQVLKNMAEKGKTIICTIHQPSSQVYALFDRLILIAEGRTAYAGPREGILNYFSRVGRHCPSGYNPADFFMEMLAINPLRENRDAVKITNLCTIFEQSETARNNWREIAAAQRTKSWLESQKNDLIRRASYKASWISQFCTIFQRSTLALLKNPTLIRARFITMIIVALLYGIVYYDQKRNQEGIMNITGVLFLLIVSTTFQSTMNVILTFCSDNHLFRKEHAAGYYRVDAYFLGKTSAELPMFLIQPVISTSVIYWMVGLSPEWHKYLIAILVITLVLNTSVSFGYMVSCLTSNVGVALALGPAMLVPLMLFGGFYMNSRSTPPYLAWMKQISWFFFGHEALMINEWRDVHMIDCDRSGALASTCLLNGTVVLESLGFAEGDIYYDLGVLAILSVAFRLVAFLLLLLRSYFY